MKNLNIIATQDITYSLFTRPIMTPNDNNPLEGVNNGIKAKVTDYCKKNIKVLLDGLQKDLKEKSEELFKLNLV